MKSQYPLLCSLAAAAVLAMTGCVTPAAQPAAASTASSSTTTAATPSLASAAGSMLGNVLQANGGASGLMSSLGVPATGTASNAAGVLTYCAKNKLLNPDKATQMADQLLSSLGLPTTQGNTAAATPQDQGYLSGAAGMIVSPTGELFSLDQIKGNVKDKACDFVMNQAKSFL